MHKPNETLDWRRSSLCANSGCVEVADDVVGVHVRDAKDPDGTVLTFTRLNWNTFLADVKAGTFDPRR
jgi:hypothetical protein